MLSLSYPGLNFKPSLTSLTRLAPKSRLTEGEFAENLVRGGVVFGIAERCAYHVRCDCADICSEWGEHGWAGVEEFALIDKSGQGEVGVELAMIGRILVLVRTWTH